MKNASLAAANRRYRNHKNHADEHRMQVQKDGAFRRVGVFEPDYAETYDRYFPYDDPTARAERMAGG